MTDLEPANRQVFQDFKFKGRSIEWEGRVGVINFSENRKIIIKQARGRTENLIDKHFFGYRIRVMIKDETVNRRSFYFKDFLKDLDDVYIVPAPEGHTPGWYGVNMIREEDGSVRGMTERELDSEAISKGLERFRLSVYSYLYHNIKWE